VGGHQGARFDVLTRLVGETGLVEQPNGREENILLFLVQTVGRQLVEQRQYRPTRSRKSAAIAVAQAASRKAPSNDVQPEMPEHDLEPPRFSRRALECLLSDWNALKSMILTGQKNEQSLNRTSPVYEDQAFLNSQSGTALLDKFTHCLIVKCSSDMLDVLLSTIINKMQARSDQIEAKFVAKRFVRSVTRVFVVFNVEMAPGQTKKKNPSNQQPNLFKDANECFKL
jgi:E3 ubiquitin-protein ligase EDD1